MSYPRGILSARHVVQRRRDQRREWIAGTWRGMRRLSCRRWHRAQRLHAAPPAFCDQRSSGSHLAPGGALAGQPWRIFSARGSVMSWGSRAASTASSRYAGIDCIALGIPQCLQRGRGTLSGRIQRKLEAGEMR